MTLVPDLTFEKIVEPAPIKALSSTLILGIRVAPEPMLQLFPIQLRAFMVEEGEIVV